MQVKLKVFRYNPETDKKPHYETYTIDAQPTDRVLDLLEYVKGYIDGTLSFRRSCAHGVCGSDAMRINGRNRLACKVLVQDLKGRRITVEPILGLQVLKDLIVDMEPFFEHYRSVLPYFVNDEPAPLRERVQSIEERERFDDTTKCILCAACTTSCPSFWANDKYVGPAAVVTALVAQLSFASRGTLVIEERAAGIAVAAVLRVGRGSTYARRVRAPTTSPALRSQMRTARHA